MTEKIEKRSDERLKCPIKAEISDPISKRVLTNDGRVRNLSRSGFSIITDCALGMRSTYKFKIYINTSSPIVVHGTILNIKRESIYQLSGVMIQDLSLLNKVQLSRYLADRMPSYSRSIWIKAVFTGAAIGTVAHMLGFSMDVTAISAVVTTAFLVFCPLI